MATHKASKSAKAAYNARRRETRAAQRYLKKAAQSSGQTAEKNRALAQAHLMNALETYDPSAPKQNFSSSIINLAANLGIDIQGQRSEFITSNEQQRSQAVKRSFQALEKNLKDSKLRSKREAQILISNKQIGKRIMGGLVDVWKDEVKEGVSAADNRKAAQKAIFKYLGVRSWAQALQKIEQNVGSELFAIAANDEKYDVVRIALQKKIIGNTFVL